MSRKKRIVAFCLVIIFSMLSISTPIKAEGLQNVFDKKSKEVFSLKTVDGQEVYIPDKDEVEEVERDNKKAKGIVEDDYAETKSVADEKASILTSYYGNTSVQYALIDNGEIILSGSAGVYSKEGNEPIAKDNMYGIGSISKMFVTTAVMKLVDEGKVNLDDPVLKYIKDFKMADKRYKKITVRMLLNHSSGLMGSTSLSNAVLLDDNDTYSHDTFLEKLKKQRLKSDPGAYSVYCNDGFALAEILVERVTGISYTDYIADNITRPLTMNNTKTPISDFYRNKLAKTYYKKYTNALPIENLNSLGAGGLYSTAEDLCSFATTFMNDSNGILSKESLQLMENKEYLNGIWPDATDNIVGYGLGWDNVESYPFNKYNIKALTKGGDSISYHSNLTVLPEKNMAMAVVSSGGSSVYNAVMAQEVLLAALKEKGDISSIESKDTLNKQEKVEVPEELKENEGIYLSPSGFIDIKIDKAGTMNLSNLYDEEQSAEVFDYTNDGVFVSRNGLSSIKFVKESNGKTYIENKYCVNLPGLGEIACDSYEAQKEDVNRLPKHVLRKWEKRKERSYYVINEKYSSTLYMDMCPKVSIDFVDGFEGYLGINRIINGNSAISILDGPGSLARDLMDFKFYRNDYLSYGNYILLDENEIKFLPTRSEFSCKIGSKGYAQWYKIPDESAGKEIIVDIPEKSSFAVYDSNGEVVNYSLITGNTNVILPKGGVVVFLGGKHSKFNVQYN